MIDIPDKKPASDYPCILKGMDYQQCMDRIYTRYEPNISTIDIKIRLLKDRWYTPTSMSVVQPDTTTPITEADDGNQ